MPRSICVPPHLHAPCAIAAFDAGLHVYLEKPLAPSSTEGARVVDAWRRAGKVGMMGFNFRFHPQVERIRQRLRAGDIGTPLGVRSVFTILPHELPEWKRTRRTGGGVLLDLASHHVDLVHHLLDDPVVRVYASARSLRGEGDHAAVQLELASGAMAQIFVSLGSVDENRMEIVGTSGKLVMDRTELLRPDHVPATQQGARLRRLRRALTALEPRLVMRVARRRAVVRRGAAARSSGARRGTPSPDRTSPTARPTSPSSKRRSAPRRRAPPSPPDPATIPPETRAPAPSSIR